LDGLLPLSLHLIRDYYIRASVFTSSIILTTMKYFLDFDRTIFDTPAFKRTLDARPTIMQLWTQLQDVLEEMADPSATGSKRKAFGKAIGTYLSTGRLLFLPEELKKYLYPDVPEFFEKHGSTCTIVTYGVKAFIMAKVTSALTGFPLNEIVYTARKKGRTIRRLTKDESGPYTFVDDAIFQLVSVSKWCPEVSVVEIRRDGKEGDGRWTVIQSLNKLEV
jgi:hypothetical protein